MTAAPPASGWPDLAGRLTTEGHVLPIRVYFEDTDFSGVVYHANYLRFMERARSDYLRLLGVGHQELAGAGVAFAVRRMEITFHRPARIDDVLEVRTRPGAVGGARIVLQQSVWRGTDLLVEARLTVGLINAEGRPQRLPEDMRNRLLDSAPGAVDNLSLTMPTEE